MTYRSLELMMRKQKLDSNPRLPNRNRRFNPFLEITLKEILIYSLPEKTRNSKAAESIITVLVIIEVMSE
jgi:hypothetical protein